MQVDPLVDTVNIARFNYTPEGFLFVRFGTVPTQEYRVGGTQVRKHPLLNANFEPRVVSGADARLLLSDRCRLTGKYGGLGYYFLPQGLFHLCQDQQEYKATSMFLMGECPGRVGEWGPCSRCGVEVMPLVKFAAPMAFAEKEPDGAIIEQA